MSGQTILFMLIITTIPNPSLASAQMTPKEVVQKQLESYNRRDIEGFMPVIADTITLNEFSSGAVTVTGYEACKKVYAHLFEASPRLHSKILKRTLFDNKVIDHEYITGLKGSGTAIELVLIYEVENEKITTITVLRKRD